MGTAFMKNAIPVTPSTRGPSRYPNTEATISPAATARLKDAKDNSVLTSPSPPPPFSSYIFVFRRHCGWVWRELASTGIL